MRLNLPSLLISCALVPSVAACSSSGDLDPGAGDDAGEGSLTLLVDADVEARPLIPNASKAGDFTTSFRVRLERAGAAVTTGTVTIESAAGAVPLTYTGEDNRWVGVQNGYEEVYRLSVTDGADFVDGVRVDGPAVHWFTSPLPGATVDTSAPVMVTWSRGEAADTARLDTDQLDELVISDTGSYSVPTGGFKSKSDEVEQERIRLDRSRRITPAGAVAGSELRVQVRNEISVVVAARP
jgi:hypothetical protein